MPSSRVVASKERAVQLVKFSIVAINLGAAGYTLYQWRSMEPRVRGFFVLVFVMTFVAAIPGFVEGVRYVWTALPYYPPPPPPPPGYEPPGPVAIIFLIVLIVAALLMFFGPLFFLAGALFIPDWHDALCARGLSHVQARLLELFVGVPAIALTLFNLAAALKTAVSQ
jgi:hypothetical protein